jgi:hypothetical protein
MTVPLNRPATQDGLFLWVLHRFAEAFEDHAVLKGGIALRLFDCPRSTTDIDYVFVPFRSKTEIRGRIEGILAEIDGAEVAVSAHSKMLRARIRVDEAAIQVEINVDLECPATGMPTGSFATSQGQPSRIVRVMSLDVAFAHKLAAWNERRLLRDLYDAYYLSVRLGAVPDLGVLDRRLAKVESRIPHLRQRRRMTRADLVLELRAAAESMDDAALRNELAPVLPADDLTGLAPRLRSSVLRIAEMLEGVDPVP